MANSGIRNYASVNAYFLKFFCFFCLLPSCILAQIKPFNRQTKPIDLRGVKIYLKQRFVEVDGLVNMTEGLIELLATTPNGKAHESVLVLNCNPALLKSAFLSIGLEPGNNTGPNTLGGNKIFIYVSWQHKSKKILICAEKLIWNARYQRPMLSTPWIFTGSCFLSTRMGKTIFAANINGELVATYYDPNAIINSSLPDRNDDTVYFVNKTLVPAKHTKIRVIFSAKKH